MKTLFSNTHKTVCYKRKFHLVNIYYFSSNIFRIQILVGVDSKKKFDINISICQFNKKKNTKKIELSETEKNN